MTEPKDSGDKPRLPHSALMKQAVAVYVKEEEILNTLLERYRSTSEIVRIARNSVEVAKFWVAEWAGVPKDFVANTRIYVNEGRIDIFFGAPDGRPIDPEQHLHAHYIFDEDCNVKMRRERNVVRKKEVKIE
ncbi:MAG: hypothetical protein NVSMB39_2930 [Candidatus Saccharimonadales bacterium]